MSRRGNTAGETAARRGDTGPGPEAVAGSGRAALRSARRLLVTGMNDVPLATVQAACDLAEAFGAAICPGGADMASPLGPVVIRAGEVAADVAEVRGRADLVIPWFCDPDSRWPGFTAEFLARRPGRPAPRQVLAVGPAPVACATRHIPLPATAAVDATRLLQALLLGHEPPPENAGAALVAAACGELATAIRSAQCVAFLTSRDGDPTGLLAWATRLLVRQVAHQRPAFAVPLPGLTTAGESATAVLTWRYGAAGAIARAERLGGAFRPAECSAATLITRGEVDAVLAVGSLTPDVEAAIAARAGGLAVVRIESGAIDTLTGLLDGLRAQGDARTDP